MAGRYAHTYRPGLPINRENPCDLTCVLVLTLQLVRTGTSFPFGHFGVGPSNIVSFSTKKSCLAHMLELKTCILEN